MSESIYEILTGLGYRLTDFGNHWRCAALYRGGHNHRSLAIRKTDGAFKDFGGDNDKGSFRKLLSLIVGNKPELIEKYINQVGVVEHEVVPKQQLPKKKIYPKSILLGLLPHWDYYTNEGISVETLKTFEIGLAQSGKLNRRYCFPIYDDQGHIIGFSGRWYKKEVPDSTIKWKHIGQKNKWLWPYHLNKEIVAKKKKVILVESPNCIIHLWDSEIQNVECLFGIELSGAILKMLLSMDLDEIIIATNNEPDNRNIGNNAAAAIKKKLLKYFDESKIRVFLPPKKDFAECSKAEIAQWYQDLTNHTKSVEL